MAIKPSTAATEAPGLLYLRTSVRVGIAASLLAAAKFSTAVSNPLAESAFSTAIIKGLNGRKHWLSVEGMRGVGVREWGVGCGEVGNWGVGCGVWGVGCGVWGVGRINKIISCLPTTGY